MAILSMRAYKLKMMLSSLFSRIDNVWSKQSSSSHKDDQRLDAVLHYPLKTASIPIVDVDILLNRHLVKIRQIERDVGLILTGCEFNFIDLVENTLRSYIGYCHLIPASEMDHHQYIGGLLEHSLDVSLKSLQNAMSYMLDEMGLIDEDQARRPRYEFAAWVCGLLHDSGKIISNVQVIGSNGEIWRPLSESIFDWAKRCGINEYTVVHQKERLNKDHETNSVHFLPLVLNEAAKNYLLGSHDDLYSMITQTLVHYHSYKGYLFNAVRKADSDSTYEDYARVWLHDSSRQKSITMGVVNAMRSLYLNWSVNKPGADLFVFNGQVFIASDRPINEVIKKCIDYGIKLPTSSKALISILLDKRILSMVSDKSTYANLYLGEFSEEDISQFTFTKNGPMSKVTPISVIMIEWPNFVIGDNPIPNNIFGALRYNTSKTSNVFQLHNRDGHRFIIPSESKPMQNGDDSAQSKPSDANTTDTTQLEPSQGNPETIEPATLAQAQAKPKPKPRAKTKPSVSQTVTDPTATDTTSSEPYFEPPQNDSTKLVIANETGPDSTKTIEYAAKEIENLAPNPTVNSEYPWVIKKRLIKPIDTALLALMQSPNDGYLWMDGASVCVDTYFLTEHTNQNLPQLLNALNYLKLIKKNSDDKHISVFKKNGKKVTYVTLNDEVAKYFQPDTHINVESEIVIASNNVEVLISPVTEVSLGDITSKHLEPFRQMEIFIEPRNEADLLNNSLKFGAPILSDNEFSLEKEEQLALTDWEMPYPELIEELRKVCPEQKPPQLTKFCRAQGVVTSVSENGEIKAKMTAVQLDELKWKLRENNE